MGLKGTIMECTFCDRTFSRKSWYDKHMCEKKKRFLNRNNIQIQQAHKLFNHWQRRSGLTKRGGKLKSIEEFCKSPFFNLFERVAAFTAKEYVISPFKYIDWLVKVSLPENVWCSATCLAAYREDLQLGEEPELQFHTSMDNISIWCRKNNIKKHQFFTKIKPGQALDMVFQNKLSPWILFGYDGCITGLTSRIDGEVMYTLDELININYWLTKIENNPKDVALIQDLCTNEFNNI